MRRSSRFKLESYKMQVKVYLDDSKQNNIPTTQVYSIVLIFYRNYLTKIITKFVGKFLFLSPYDGDCKTVHGACTILSPSYIVYYIFTKI